MRIPSSFPGRTFWLSLALVAAAALGAAPVQAGTLSQNGSDLVYQADTGEFNDVTVTAGSDDVIEVSDFGVASITLGATPDLVCSPAGPSQVKTCTDADRMITRIVVRADDMGDIVNLDLQRAGMLGFADGGAGEDQLVGGPEPDVLRGGTGFDLLEGRGGNDELLGEGDDDFLFGGEGDDLLRGSVGLDELHGGPGNEAGCGVDGGPGNDRLFGGEGDDGICGGGGLDLLMGGEGDDRLADNDGAGGAGADRFDGGAHVAGDTIDYSDRGDPVFLTLDNDPPSVDPVPVAFTPDDGETGEADAVREIENATTGNGADSVTGDDDANTITTSMGDDDVTGAGGDDVIDAGFPSPLLPPDDDEVFAGPGNDVLIGGQKADFLDGGPGVDRISGGPGNDEVHGGDGDDGPGEACLDGGPDNDEVHGGDGDDYLCGSGGLDWLLGEAGDDNLFDGDITSVNVDNDRIDGGTHEDQGDRVHYFDRTATVVVTLDDLAGDFGDSKTTGDDGEVGERDAMRNVENVGTGSGFDDITGDADANEIFSGDGDDQIDTLGGQDFIDAGAGHDIVNAGLDRDSILGGDGSDQLNGGDGVDGVDGGPGGDTVDGGPGNDGRDGAVDLFAGQSDDFGGLGFCFIGLDAGEGVTGGPGNDTVLGGPGNDVVCGGPDGMDLLKGEDGDDVLFDGDDVFAGTVNRDRYDGGNHVDGDVLVYPRFGQVDAASISVNVSLNDDLANVDPPGTAGNDGANGEGDATRLIEHVITGNGADTIVGNDLRNRVNSGYGTDILTGNGGDDYLNAAPIPVEGRGDADGIDTADGNAGDDVLIGGADGDDLDGGADDDRLYGEFATPAFGDGPPAADTLAGGLGHDIIDAGGGDDVNVSGGDGNDVVLGGTGNDALDGDAGRDMVDGGVGDDTVRGGTDADEVRGGSGLDTLLGQDGDDVLDDGDREPSLNAAGVPIGPDALDGGPGRDAVTSYAAARGDLTINLATGAGNGRAGENDTLTAVENAVGGAGNDVITGSTAANELAGGRGDDTIAGGDGSDALLGGDGADQLTGSAGQDELRGGDGPDTIGSVDGGPDQVGCGADVDTVDGEALDAIEADCETVNRGAVPAPGPPAPVPPAPIGPPAPVLPPGCDVAGTAGNDVIKGTAKAERICGLGGNDVINGLGGNDVLIGGTGDDRLVGGAGKDRFLGGPGKDFLNMRDRANEFGDGGPGTDTARINRGDKLRRVEKRR